MACYLHAFISISAIPFMAVPGRTIYTVAVDKSPVLDNFHGRMQAMLSMVASVAGFTIPLFVSKLCLVEPSAVDASVSKRELSPVSLSSPFLTFLVLLGMLLMINRTKNEELIEKIDLEKPSETTSLLPAADVPKRGLDQGGAFLSCSYRGIAAGSPQTKEQMKNHYKCPKQAISRQGSVSMMGIAQPSANVDLTE